MSFSVPGLRSRYGDIVSVNALTNASSRSSAMTYSMCFSICFVVKRPSDWKRLCSTMRGFQTPTFTNSFWPRSLRKIAW